MGCKNGVAQIPALPNHGITAQIKISSQEVTAHLNNELIPFWIQHTVYKMYGGFHANFYTNGTVTEIPEKYLNTHSPVIWLFSQLNMNSPTLANKEKAKQGVDFSIKYFWDKQNGGWRWKVKSDGSPLYDGKVVYRQSFTICALADYYISNGYKHGLEYAEKTSDLLQKYCVGTHFAGYYKSPESNWQTAAPGFSACDCKGLDTHMHVMEAFTSLYLAS
jgi:mannose/cellobiose epimerase-like protein (N-acyl-D-glucosamine 2-epimerase family)